MESYRTVQRDFCTTHLGFVFWKGQKISVAYSPDWVVQDDPVFSLARLVLSTDLPGREFPGSRACRDITYWHPAEVEAKGGFLQMARTLLIGSSGLYDDRETYLQTKAMQEAGTLFAQPPAEG